MLMPSILGRDLFDEMFDLPFSTRQASGLMRTDVVENKDNYTVTMDLPGVKKEDLKAELKDGYLTISATTGYNNDQKDSEGRYIRRERYAGSFSRNFYVGDGVKESDIQAKFTDGTLTLLIPKKDPAPELPEKKYIAIEG